MVKRVKRGEEITVKWKWFQCACPHCNVEPGQLCNLCSQEKEKARWCFQIASKHIIQNLIMSNFHFHIVSIFKESATKTRTPREVSTLRREISERYMECSK